MVKIGGAGNIGSAGIRQASAVPHDTDAVPEMARRSSSERRDGVAFHTGVGFSFLPFPPLPRRSYLVYPRR